MYDVIFRLEIPAKARREIAHPPITFDQMLAVASAIVGPDFILAAWCLGHESVGRLQNDLPFLLELFLAGLDHLVVRGFLDPVLDQVLADVLFVFDAGRTMAGR